MDYKEGGEIRGRTYLQRKTGPGEVLGGTQA